jgi:3-oxoacyl-[acyl-carrier protein] reductase
MLLNNKTAVITGCNRGIGFSIMETFCKNGATVIACVRKTNKDFEKNVENLIKKYEKKIHIVIFDLEHEEELNNSLSTIKNLEQNIDILVNNAGINQISLFQMTTIKSFRKVFETNFFSIVNFTQKMLKIIKKNNFSKIINIASNAADLSDAGRSAYAPSKAALISLTKVLSKELGVNKINVNAVSPGLVNTDMMKDTPQKAIEEAISRTPLKKVAEPIDVAKTVLYLASDDSNHITGEIINVTGGM